MYLALVALLMLVLPSLCVALDANMSLAAITMALVAKWFVFWPVGIRLMLAGLRQIAQPRYTAHVILGLTSDEPLVVVRELGFSNVALGLIGIGNLWFSSWRLAGALAGGTFYGLAGVLHLFQTHRNRSENIAMVSDLLAAVILGVVYVSSLRAGAVA
jgi:hypothetical protein